MWRRCHSASASQEEGHVEVLAPKTKDPTRLGGHALARPPLDPQIKPQNQGFLNFGSFLSASSLLLTATLSHSKIGRALLRIGSKVRGRNKHVTFWLIFQSKID